MLEVMMLRLFLYFSETVEDGLAFTPGHMQSLVHLVGEECIFFHLAGKACATQQVGMEQQGIAFGIGCLTSIANAGNLSGSHEHQCAFLIVIPVAAVSQFPVYLFFQVDAIETIEFLFMLEDLDLTEVDEGH